MLRDVLAPRGLHRRPGARRATSDPRAALRRAEGRPARGARPAASDHRGAAARSASPGRPSSRARRGDRSGARARRHRESRGAARGSSSELPAGTRPPYLDAQARRFRARLGRRRGRSSTPQRRSFRELGLPFWLAVTLLEHGEWLEPATSRAEPLAEAREIFERLEATAVARAARRRRARRALRCQRDLPELRHREPRRGGSSAPSAGLRLRASARRAAPRTSPARSSAASAALRSPADVDRLPPPAAAPAAERRLVSVLFADLVGFTTLSESRDAEEVRELLSRYFDTCRRLIELYGGTVEKFIGDAVMAVWGTPTATEDDAERAVRAALDLVAAVSALGDEIGAPELARPRRRADRRGRRHARRRGSGHGRRRPRQHRGADPVRSRAGHRCSSATPTRRATELTIVYEDAGAHELKGKEEPAQLFRALRVASGRARGAQVHRPRAAVRRTRPRAATRQGALPRLAPRSARRISSRSMGIAGIGKSRLAWEFYKYFDGLVDNVYWHRGRCLAYGEGVTYWALADMVRMRARISEDDDDADRALEARRDARPSTCSTRTSGVRRAAARAACSVSPRSSPRTSATTSSPPGGSSSSGSRTRTPPSSCSRTCSGPTRACSTSSSTCSSGRSRARSSCLPSRVPSSSTSGRTGAPGIATSRRSISSPLSESAMTELLDGFVPGLPEELRTQILGSRRRRAALRRRDGAHAARPRAARSGRRRLPPDRRRSRRSRCPRRCTALVASRLDGLPAEERRLLQDAAVLGKTFTRQGLAAVGGLTEAELDPLLVVTRAQGDPRRAGRSHVARARPVRLPPGPRAPRRLRDALEEGAPRAPPRRGRVPRRRIPERRRDRRGPRLALPRRVHGTSRRGGRGRGQGEGPRRARAGRRTAQSPSEPRARRCAI